MTRPVPAPSRPPPPERPAVRAVEPIPVKTPEGEMIFLQDPAGLADEVAVSSAGLFLISLMDGERDLTDIQAEFCRRTGEILLREDLEALVAQLDDRHLLDSPAFARHARGLEEDFLADPVRPAAFAGRCYPETAPEVTRQLDAYFTHPDRPARGAGDAGAAGGAPHGARDEKPRRGDAVGGVPAEAAPRITALIAPHIDPPRGGPAYALAYQELAEPPELVIVLGTSHAPTGALFTFTRKDYRTPLGAVRTDSDALDRLEARFGSGLYTGEIRHRSEHSVEFQMLFLAHRFPGAAFTALPVLCGSPHEHLLRGESPESAPGFEDLVDELAALARTRRTLLIASADLAHVGPQFGDPEPCDETGRARLEREDRAMLEPVLAGDRHAFRKVVWDERDRNRICGFMPIYTTLALLERMSSTPRGQLLAYRQWPDPLKVVTYTSIAFR